MHRLQQIAQANGLFAHGDLITQRVDLAASNGTERAKDFRIGVQVGGIFQDLEQVGIHHVGLGPAIMNGAGGINADVANDRRHVLGAIIHHHLDVATDDGHRIAASGQTCPQGGIGNEIELPLESSSSTVSTCREPIPKACGYQGPIGAAIRPASPAGDGREIRKEAQHP